MNTHRLSYPMFPTKWMTDPVHVLVYCLSHTHTYIYQILKMYKLLHAHAQAQARVNGNLHGIVRMYILFISSRGRLLDTGVN